MTDEQRETIRRGPSTAGTWETGIGEDTFHRVGVPQPCWQTVALIVPTMRVNSNWRSDPERDAAFIAAASSCAPTLLARCERLEGAARKAYAVWDDDDRWQASLEVEATMEALRAALGETP